MDVHRSGSGGGPQHCHHICWHALDVAGMNVIIIYGSTRAIMYMYIIFFINTYTIMLVGLYMHTAGARSDMVRTNTKATIHM